VPRRLGSRVVNAARTAVVADRFPPGPHYPSDVRAVTASLRDAAGGWPAALWLAAAAAIAIYGAGGASSGGIAFAAAAGLGACALAAVTTAGGLRAWAPPPRRVIVYVAALAAVGLVSYASIGWSLTPQASYSDADRWLVAAAAAAAGVVLAGLLRRPLEAAVWVLCAASLPLIAYAIQQRAHGEFFQTSPRLQGVLGYPNAIGAYAALAAPGALWLASAPQRARRVAGCATLALLVLGLGLASSRGGMLAALIGCGVWLALSERRTESGAAVLVVLAATAAVARWGLDQRSFKSLDVPFTVPAGSRLVWYSAIAVLAAAVVGPLAVELAQRAGPRLRRWCFQAVVAVAAVAVLLGAIRLSSRHGGPGGALSYVWHQLSGGGAVGSADHLSTLSTNLRGRWWGEAWDAFAAHPWHGNGAGTFETIDRLARPDFQQAGQEHSASLHVLSGMGLLGAVPAVIALAAAGACVAAVTRLRGNERAAALALAAGVGAFALHNQIDWEWQQTALTVLAYPIPVLIACAAGGTAVAVRRPRRSYAVLAATACALAVIPVMLPVLSNRALARADRLDNQGRYDEARAEADSRGGPRPHLGRRATGARQPPAGARASGRRTPRRRPRTLARAQGRPLLARARGLPALVLARQRLAQEPRPRPHAGRPRHGLHGLRHRGHRDQRCLHPQRIRRPYPAGHPGSPP